MGRKSMNNDRIDFVVREILTEWLGQFKDNDTISSMGCDSLDAVEMIMAIEDELDVEEFTEEFVETIDKMTIIELIEAIQTYLNKEKRK
jgi:acyl carrier protein